MFLTLINTDEICKDLQEVNSKKIFESGKFSKTGLFSLQIFGPLKSDSCACNKITYRGRSLRHSTCKKCGVDIVSSEERRRRYAKIVLPMPILNPIFYYIITLSKSSSKEILNNMLTYTSSYYFDNGNIIKLEDGESIDNNVELLTGLKGVLKYIEFLVDTEDKPEFIFIRDNFDKIVINNVLVIPPDFRPCGGSSSNKHIVEPINELYRSLIASCNKVKKIPYNIGEDTDIYKTNFKYIQINTTKLYDYILTKMSKKEGLLRANILGKRVDFSGRAVISPDPTLTLDRCRIPYWIILEVLKPQLVTYLVNIRLCKRYNQAVKLIDNCIKSKSTELYEIVSEFCNDKICILNRQPTLHRLSILAFKVSIHLGNTIQIHPMICHPFNADFDGDQMALYFPITRGSIRDTYEKIGVWNNLISQTDIKLVPQPSQDIVLGIFSVTQ
jgi:DNA-directed RNA polymerase subunit beta'